VVSLVQVTSPSYLLDNTYAYGVLPEDALEPEAVVIHHMDLYRLPGPALGGEGDGGFDASMLGIPGIYPTCLCLVEWPERLRPRDLPLSFLDVEINISVDEVRVVTLTSVGGWGEESGQLSALPALATRLKAEAEAGTGTGTETGAEMH
jgi:tRNA A37 threonylcarbamoyladenosine biosynthesis protein TsaE